MKWIFSVLFLSCSLFAQGEHLFLGKYVFRHHEEKGYSFSLEGIGAEYSFVQPEQLNFTLSLSLNPKDIYSFVEEQIIASYKFRLHPNIVFYPCAMLHGQNHSFRSERNTLYYHYRYAGHCGVGLEIEPNKNGSLFAEFQTFRDFQFVSYRFGGAGHKFYKVIPLAIWTTAGTQWKWDKGGNVKVKVSWSIPFAFEDEDKHWDMATEIGFGWRF